MLVVEDSDDERFFDSRNPNLIQEIRAVEQRRQQAVASEEVPVPVSLLVTSKPDKEALHMVTDEACRSLKLNTAASVVGNLMTPLALRKVEEQKGAVQGLRSDTLTMNAITSVLQAINVEYDI